MTHLLRRSTLNTRVRVITLAIACLAKPASTSAQVVTPASPSATGIIRGVVLDRAGGTPIADVSVRLQDGTQAVTTDEAGRFELREDLAEGFTLVVSAGRNSCQQIRIPAWTPGQETQIRMAPWREVIVRLQGLGERHRHSLLNLTIDHSKEPLACGIELAPEGAVRRFAFRLAPGQHELGVNSVPELVLLLDKLGVLETPIGPVSQR